MNALTPANQITLLRMLLIPAFVILVVYGYLGISIRALHDIRSLTGTLAYVVVSGTMVILALIALARRFGREA